MAHVKCGVSPQEWKRIKGMGLAAPRMLHVSKYAKMIPNPLGEALPAIPWTSKGITFNEGRNAAKREKRAQAKALRQGATT